MRKFWLLLPWVRFATVNICREETEIIFAEEAAKKYLFDVIYQGQTHDIVDLIHLIV